MSTRIDWLVGCIAVWFSSIVYAQTDQRDSSLEDSNSSPSRTPNYRSGESYYESNLNRNLENVENAYQNQYQRTAASRMQLLRDFAAHRQALLNYGRTKSQLQREYNEVPELVAARKNLAAAEQDYRLAKAAVLQRLERNPEYRQAVTLRQDFSELAKQYSDQPVTSPDRQHIKKKLADVILRITELEERALQEDWAATVAQQQRQQNLELVARLKAASMEAMTVDARFTAAEVAKQRTRNQVQLQQRDYAANLKQFLQTQDGHQQLVQQRLALEQSQRNSSQMNLWNNYWANYGLNYLPR